MLEEAALFKYELAIVAILKNEAPYIKEWIDYHLLAGVDHFYLYDNESTDNIREILNPYIISGVVDYAVCPGKCAQMVAYNNAIQKYKFDCNYMLFIDLDEFVYPHENKSIVEIVKEYFDMNPNIAGFVIHVIFFGSSGQEKANFDKDVLERFIYRSEINFPGNRYVKTILNPRLVELIRDPHVAIYFNGKFAVREDKKVISNSLNDSSVADRISINHYQIKSREEYIIRYNRMLSGDGYYLYQRDKIDSISDEEWYKLNENRNDIYDDGILKYRAMRQGLENARGGGIESAQQINQRRFNALIETLSPIILPANLSLFNDENDIFSGKMHVFLTCWAVSRDLKSSILNEDDANFFEELSLKCLYKSLLESVEIWQLQLLLEELPKILSYKYPVVNDIKEIIISAIPQFMNYRRMQNDWQSYKQLDYLLQIMNI